MVFRNHITAGAPTAVYVAFLGQTRQADMSIAAEVVVAEVLITYSVDRDQVAGGGERVSSREGLVYKYDDIMYLRDGHGTNVEKTVRIRLDGKNPRCSIGGKTWALGNGQKFLVEVTDKWEVKARQIEGEWSAIDPGDDGCLALKRGRRKIGERFDN